MKNFLNIYIQFLIRIKIERDSKALLSRFNIVPLTKLDPYELQNVCKKFRRKKNILNIRKYIKFYIELLIRKKMARDSIELLSLFKIVKRTNL